MQKQIEAHAVGLMGCMDDGPDMSLAVLQGMLSGLGNGRTVLTGVEPNGEEHLAKSRITAPGDASHPASVATIILFYYGDMIGLKGKVRQWYGWLIIVLSDIAFASVTIFEMKRLFITEAER